MLKITRVSAESTSKRRPKPVRDALQLLDTHGECVVTIETDAGVNGRGSITFGRLDAAPEILAAIINKELGPQIVGDDAFLIRGARDKLWATTDYHGSTGLSLMGVAGIDIALWDVVGKALRQPVWRLLGAMRDRVPTYAMVGWLDFDLDALRAICLTAVEQGFRGVKMKVGAFSLEEDLKRIRAVRETVGPDIKIMVDANQVFTVSEALRRGKAFEELDCFWFEEPIRADNHAGLAELAHALTIPIASGENDFGKRQFKDLFERGSVDIVQPDIRRAGGVTECLEIGLLADAFNIPYASHGGGVHLHVLAALPNAMFMESGLQRAGEPSKLVDGCFLLPEEPGFGSSSH